jgi:asparagine synthase (glutamine-hydrolysing)
MCGIAGILHADARRPVEVADLLPLGGALAHRGPDGQGTYCAPGVGLVHRRLAIIDLAGGRQPLGNEDGTIQVVFNGEIYNYAELRAGLIARGHRLATASDTEVLVHLYEELGAGLVERLRGMFAFALWDGPRRRLLLARDRVGQKPLYVYRDGQRLVFASELKAIAAAPGVRLELDPVALDEYLTWGFVPGERAIYRRVIKLPAAHTLQVGPGDWDIAPRRYWQLRFGEGGEAGTTAGADAGAAGPERQSDDQWRQAVGTKLAETVRAHQIADVPVGAFLSGGLDSSAIVALVAGEAAGKDAAGGGGAGGGNAGGGGGAASGGGNAGGGPLQTFSIGFAEDGFSELPHARRVAELFGTRHVEEIVTHDMAAELEQLAWHYDEPFADPSALPTLALARLTARHVKVALSGDGGDEAFGGYARYPHDLREAALRRRLPAVLRRTVLAGLAARWPQADWLPRVLRARTRLTNLSLEADAAYANTLSLCRGPLRRSLLSADVRNELNGHRPEDRLQGAYRAAGGDALAGMLAADIDVLLPDDFLTKVDRASMAHGLEVRPPMVDHELLELCARAPSRLKVSGGETKVLFKQICETFLPRDLVRRRKHGFDVPVDRWLAGPLREQFNERVLSPTSPVATLIDQTAARRLYAAHCRGQARQGQVLWSLLVLGCWADRWLGGVQKPALELVAT